MPQAQDLITVARLMRPHGVHGDIKAEPLSHDPNRHKTLHDVTLALPNGSIQTAKIQSSKGGGSVWFLHFEGYESPEAVVALSNALVQVPATERLAPPPGQYYPSDLEGLTVIDETGKACGKVLGLLEMPSVNCFELQLHSKQVLAPWISDCIGNIDLEKQTIEVRTSYLSEMTED